VRDSAVRVPAPVRGLPGTLLTLQIDDLRDIHQLVHLFDCCCWRRDGFHIHHDGHPGDAGSEVRATVQALPLDI